MDADHNVLATESDCRIIAPDGWKVPEVAANIHGITTERASAEGIPISQALDGFAKALRQSDMLVAHNVAFDRPVLLSEAYRARSTELLSALHATPTECTMRMGTLPGTRWPKLAALDERLFGIAPPADSLHRADVDTELCAQIWVEMKKRERLNV